MTYEEELVEEFRAVAEKIFKTVEHPREAAARLGDFVAELEARGIIVTIRGTCEYHGMLGGIGQTVLDGWHVERRVA